MRSWGGIEGGFDSMSRGLDPASIMALISLQGRHDRPRSHSDRAMISQRSGYDRVAITVRSWISCWMWFRHSMEIIRPINVTILMKIQRSRASTCHQVRRPIPLDEGHNRDYDRTSLSLPRVNICGINHRHLFQIPRTCFIC